MGTTLSGLAACIFASWGFIALAEWQAFHPWGSRFLYERGMDAFLLHALAAPMAILYLVARGGASGTAAGVTAAVVGGALWVGAFFAGAVAHRQIRHAAVPVVEAQARPLVRAIETFSREHGRPPFALAELIPRYLPSIPVTGLAAFPAFEYRQRGVAGVPPAETDDPWSLHVSTAFGLNFDSMVYVPSGRYPEVGWGGAVVRIGAWAYVWE